MPMSDTPRTDRFFGDWIPTQPHAFYDFARELERENAALRRALQNAAYAIEALADPNMDDWPTEEARASYAKLKKAEADAALA